MENLTLPPIPTENSTENNQNNLIGMEPILNIIESALYSAFVKNCRRVSICLVAPQEAGKTQAMLHFENFPKIEVYSDITAKPIDLLAPKIRNDEITHLILTDLVAIAAHNKKTSALVYSRLSSMMEEGIRTTADGGGRIDWMKDGKAPTLGLIAGITPELYADNRQFWRKTGFISRFIPLCYGHSHQTQLEVRARMLESHSPTIPKKIEIPEETVDVGLSEHYKQEIKRLAQFYARDMSTYGYRFTSHLSALARARALRQGRSETSADDIDFLYYVASFSNPKDPYSI